MKKTNVIKRIIALLVLSSTVVSLFGCFEPSTYEKDGVTYNKRTHGWDVNLISDANYPKAKAIYVLDQINGTQVVRIGSNSPVYGSLSIKVHIYYAERIYFPWSISMSQPDAHQWNFSDCPLKYVVSSSTVALVDTYSYGHKYVIPKILYLNLSSGDTANIRLGESTNSFLNTKFSLFLPANISYFFNYEDNPNEGYFFVDIIEETGKLTKPPYDPKREGYTFDGWYKEAECINKWNFDIDEVSIKFDDDGNRIYEEICLYAKWIANTD